LPVYYSKSKIKQMNNFEYKNPVKIIFGKGSIAKLAKELPDGVKILVTYGGGSIFQNGVYDQVAKALEGFSWMEFGGIEPNPTYETCMEAVKVVKRENIGFLLSVGGGSVLDATKFIAAASLYENGDPWDFFQYRFKINVKKAIPNGGCSYPSGYRLRDEWHLRDIAHQYHGKDGIRVGTCYAKVFCPRPGDSLLAP
jgi:hypothetical protein